MGTMTLQAPRSRGRAGAPLKSMNAEAFGKYNNGNALGGNSKSKTSGLGGDALSKPTMKGGAEVNSSGKVTKSPQQLAFEYANNDTKGTGVARDSFGRDANGVGVDGSTSGGFRSSGGLLGNGSSIDAFDQ